MLIFRTLDIERKQIEDNQSGRQEMQQRLLSKNKTSISQCSDIKIEQGAAEKIKRVINPAQMRIDLKVVQIAENGGAHTDRH